MSHQGAWSGGTVVTATLFLLMLLAAFAYSYFTGRPVEVGDIIKISAAPEIEDPEMQRCKAVQALVENQMRSAFADVKNALEVSVRDTQDKELALITLWSDMVKSTPDDTDSLNSIVDDINLFRGRYSTLQTDVSKRLNDIGQSLNDILSGCGLPDPRLTPG